MAEVPKEKKEEPEPSDNLQKVRGIGSKIESGLNAIGIRTYADILNSDRETLISIDGISDRNLNQILDEVQNTIERRS